MTFYGNSDDNYLFNFEDPGFFSFQYLLNISLYSFLLNLSKYFKKKIHN